MDEGGSNHDGIEQLLKFYSSTRRKTGTMTPLANSRASLSRVVAAIGTMLVVGCATVGTPPPDVTPTVPAQPPSGPTVPRNAEPPPPKVNLSGFPLPYRQGYADGCASTGGVEHKDAARFSSDMNYRTGWTDGRALCGKK
jgi:hypothetical protein